MWFLTSFKSSASTFTLPRSRRRPRGTVRQTNANLWKVVRCCKSKRASSCWGTANMFSHPRFTRASTSPSADIFAYCANSVKEMLDVSLELVVKTTSSCREGSASQHRHGPRGRHAAKFFHMAVDYAKKIGFKGQFLIEPNPASPPSTNTTSIAPRCYLLRKYKLENISNSTSRPTTPIGRP